MKILFKALIILTILAGTWFALSQIDFVKLLKIKTNQSTFEKKIGNLVWEDIKQKQDVVKDDSIAKYIQKLLTPICKKNNIEQDSLKVFIVQNPEINAFALPDNYLVVNSGLIEASKNPEALLGVLGHEIAHIEHKHVMKKLSKEIGLSVLLSIGTGTKGRELTNEVFKNLSSTAYDRNLEEEADITSVDYLINANINPVPFADFLYELSLNESDGLNLTWLETHPDSEERSKYILDYIKDKKIKKDKISNSKEWENLKNKVRTYNE